jgi:hypothetical protein
MYLASEISEDNNIGIELQKRLTVASKCYYRLLKYLRSSLSSRKTKVTI